MTFSRVFLGLGFCVVKNPVVQGDLAEEQCAKEYWTAQYRRRREGGPLGCLALLDCLCGAHSCTLLQISPPPA